MLDSLRQLLDEKGQTLVGVLLQDDLYVVYSHDPKIAGMKPVMKFCRDSTDYIILKKQWEERGMVVLCFDKDFSKAVQGAIDTVKAG